MKEDHECRCGCIDQTKHRVSCCCFDPPVVEKFTFFWRGPFSQWHKSDFSVAGVTFNCAEQFMMYAKATLFGDEPTAALILDTPKPSEQKNLGRQVSGYNESVWQLFREGVVYTANYEKFSQNEELQRILLATRGTTLVEASPVDRIWGIGLAEDNPLAQNRDTWSGLNLLGEAITRVRKALEN